MNFGARGHCPQQADGSKCECVLTLAVLAGYGHKTFRAPIIMGAESFILNLLTDFATYGLAKIIFLQVDLHLLLIYLKMVDAVQFSTAHVHGEC